MTGPSPGAWLAKSSGMQELRPGLVFAHYLLERKLAFGGMGDVYLAKDRSAGNALVALKILQRDRCADERRVRAFEAEGELSERMDHSNLPRIFERGSWRGWHYLAMEWVNGVTLTELTEALKARDQHLSSSAVSYLARKLCAALHHAHELVDDDGRPMRLVHRDVTPRNVMVSLDGEIKLIDFGIARTRRSASSTGAGEIKGTLEFLSPEQLRGLPVDRRTDLHGAALTIFYAATQVSPFWRGDESKTLDAIAKEPIPSLSAHRDDLPAQLDQALRRSACKEPQERFSTARELAHAFPQPSLDAEAELASLVRQIFGLRPAPSPAYTPRAAPSFWRRLGLAFGTAVVLLGLGLAAQGSSESASTAKQENRVELNAEASSPSPGVRISYRKVGRPK